MKEKSFTLISETFTTVSKNKKIYIIYTHAKSHHK